MTAFLWLLLPLLPIVSSFTFLGADTGSYLVWWAALSGLGLAFLPLSARIFKGIPDSGWTFAKPIALAVVSLLMWTASMLHILPFRQWSLLAIAVACAAALYVPFGGYKRFLEAFSAPERIRAVAVQETIFGTALLLWTYVRGLKPAIDGLEKFMDFGFMMSMMRTDWLPAKDMWLAGSTINYYYYGQYVYTLITKVSGVAPAVAYNLAMASTFAFTFALSFAVVYAALTVARRRLPAIPASSAPLGGFVGALLVTVGGNSHAFLYATDSPGHPLLVWLGKIGVQVGSTSSFWFANSTRYIGYAPDNHDKTIHEFPYYSFLVADLHAHVIDLMFVLLFLGLLVMLVSNTAAREAAKRFADAQAQAPQGDVPDRGWFRREAAASAALLRSTVSNPRILIPGFLLGIFMMTNFWDFAIYFVVASLALFFVNARGYGATFTLESLPVFALQILLLLVPFLFISNPLLALLLFAVALAANTLLTALVGDALTVTGTQASLLFFLAHLVALPFNLDFEPISKSIALSVNHTPIFQLIVLWGAHFALGAIFVWYVLRRRRMAPADPDAAASRTGMARWLNGFEPTDLLVAGLFVCAAGLVLAPEIFYVVDIYSGDYKRANTMFKFTYQAFVLFSLVIGYAFARIPTWSQANLPLPARPSAKAGKTAKKDDAQEEAQEEAPEDPAAAARLAKAEQAYASAVAENRRRSFDRRWRVVPIVMLALLFIPLVYPVVSTQQWIGSFALKNYEGLDGVKPFGTKSGGLRAPDLAAVYWLNENVKGQPTVLEAYGDSYTDACRISAYTGLPTVIGWQTHEWLWRTSKATPSGYSDVVAPHQAEVRNFFESTDAAAAKEFLRKYAVAYVVVGELERDRFDKIDEPAIQALGTKVFESGSLYIVAIDPSYYS